MIGIVVCPRIMEEWPKDQLLCQDHRIHIRLKTYDRPEIISGFINKLTFLLTYKMRAYQEMEELLEDYEFNTIVDKLKEQIPGCEGIKILKEYSKLHPNSKFGNIKEEYRASSDSSYSLTGLLAAFQKTLKYFTSIREILFNDNISIILSDTPLVDERVYIKFANKIIRKFDKENNYKYNLVDLWSDDDGDN